MRRLRGRVEAWDEEAGSGVLVAEDGTQVAISFAAIEETGFRALLPGRHVEYLLARESAEGQPQASRVWPLTRYADASPEVVDFVSERGGRLYVFADGHGLVSTSTEPQPGPTYRVVHLPEFDLFEDETISVSPFGWVFRLQRFPRRAVLAFWGKGFWDG